MSRFRQYMRDTGVTVDDLATRLNYTRPHLSRLLHRHIPWPLGFEEKLKRVFIDLVKERVEASIRVMEELDHDLLNWLWERVTE